MRRSHTLKLACGVWLAFLSLPAWATSPAQYDGALAQVQTALNAEANSLQEAGSSTVSPTAVASHALLPITEVDRSGRGPQSVDSTFLLRSIARAESTHDTKGRIVQLRAVSQQIGILRHDLFAETPSTAVVGAPAVRAARAVLSQNVYGYDPLPPPGPLDRFGDWLSRTLSRLFRRSRSPSLSAPNISPVFIKGLLIVLLVGVFAVVVGVIVQMIRRRTPRPRPLALDETEAALVEARDTDSLRALAEQKAQQGDHRLALRFIYLALLVALDTDGVLRFDRSKTNWEYLRALRSAGRPDVYEAMTPLTREFDRVWYGFAPADAADYSRALTQYDALKAVSKSVPTTRPTVASA